MTRCVVILAALAALTAGVRGSGATFVAKSVAPGTTLRAAVDWSAPVVKLTDPGAMRRTVTLAATATDASALASFRLQARPAGAAAWSDVCSGTAAALACAFDTTTVPDGSYDVRAVATDVLGHTASDVRAARTVDNTAPRGLDVQTTDVAGGVEGRPEKGDVITFTFSEPMAPATILSGWSGADTPVSVQIVNGNPDVVGLWNAAGTARLPLGTINTDKKVVGADLTFPGSTMTLSGSTVRVVLGTPATALVQPGNPPATGTLTWTPLAGMTDLAGNALAPVSVVETGAADRDF